MTLVEHTFLLNGAVFCKSNAIDAVYLIEKPRNETIDKPIKSGKTYSTEQKKPSSYMMFHLLNAQIPTH